MGASAASSALVWATDTLERAGVDSPRTDAEWLLSHVTGIPRGALIPARLDGPDGHQLDDHQFGEFERLVRARAARVPLQHLIGTAPFRYLELAVGPGVFVPRPETEIVAGWVIERAQQLGSPRVVDLCAGSGAIAAAVAAEVPSARVYAVELADEAHRWAEHNLAGTGVDLRHGDIREELSELDGYADIVVANPPYIPVEAWETVQIEVRDYDPGLALWGGRDGLDMIAAVEEAAARLLRPGGLVAVEHADVQARCAPQIFVDSGRWDHVRDRFDLAGKPRFVTAERRRGHAPIV